jgi:hypothetical protein
MSVPALRLDNSVTTRARSEGVPKRLAPRQLAPLPPTGGGCTFSRTEVGPRAANTGPVATGSVGTEAGHAGQAIYVPAPRSGPRRRSNASRGPDHKEVPLLMANENPTDRGHAVALNLPTEHIAFLRDTFTTVRDGLLGDLGEQSDQLRNPERLRWKVDAYGRLLAALRSGEVVSDAAVVDVLAGLARSIDADNEYERVAFEHRALWGLHRRLAGSACGGGR